MGVLPKDAEILPPYDDRLFKVIMTSPDAKPALKFVVKEIINDSVDDVVVRNTEMPVSDINEKMPRFDVNCLINDGSQADIEMQAHPMKEESGSGHEILRARSIFNLCDLHATQNSRGVEYNCIRRTYQVMFCAFPVFKGHSEFIYRFSMRHDEDNWLLHNAIQSVFVDLTKLNDIINKPAEQMTDMERFSVFLRYADDPDYRDIVNRIIDTREALKVAAEVLMSVSKDEREKAILRNRKIARMDYESDMRTSERIGRREGRKEGILTVAKNALQMNMDIDAINRLTGLTYREIEDLRNLM